MAFLFGPIFLLLPCAAQAQEDPFDYDYLVYISRGTALHRFPCKQVRRDGGFVTDPDVEGFFPYRLSRGEEHVVIIQPITCMPVYWLRAEQRYAQWIETAAGSLAACENLLVKVKQLVRQQQDFARRLGAYEAQWQAGLQAATARSIEQLGFDVRPADLNVLALWAEWSERKKQILNPPPPEPADQVSAEPPPDETIPEAPTQRPIRGLAQPGYLEAGPAPNDDGTRIAVRWPIGPHDLQARTPGPDGPAPPSPPPPELPQKELTEAERHELAEIEGKLAALRPAYQYARYFADAQAKRSGLRDAAAQLRDDYLKSAATFALIHALVERETRVQLASCLGVMPDELAPRSVAQQMHALAKRLDDARGKAGLPEASVADLNAFDRFSYVHYLALSYLERVEKGISPTGIENDLLWQLDKVLQTADLPEEGASTLQQVPDASRLRALLEESHRLGTAIETDGSEETLQKWQAATQSLHHESDAPTEATRWVAAKTASLKGRLRGAGFARPDASHFRREKHRAHILAKAASERRKAVKRRHAGRRYYFHLGLKFPPPAETPEPFPMVASATARPAIIDTSKLFNLAYAAMFAAAIVGMVMYVRWRPDVFVRRIAGLEAVDEAVGRATEMGKPVLFVHGLTGVSDIAVLASINILSRLARHIAEYDSDLLVVNNDPIVYSLSQEVVQDGYTAAGRPDAYNPDNVFMVAYQQFPYVAGVAGIMTRRQPAANFFMGYFYAEALILAEVGASTGAIQIAGTDSFTQLPFFITTCDYTLMGEELYAAGAYLSRNARMLATLKAQDLGKSVLLCALPCGWALSNFGVNFLRMLFTAYEKGF